MGQVEVTVSVVRRTRAALLVSDTNGTEGWVPRSQVQVDEIGSVAGTRCVLTMPIWLANSRGFVGEVVS